MYKDIFQDSEERAERCIEVDRSELEPGIGELCLSRNQIGINENEKKRPTRDAGINYSY